MLLFGSPVLLVLCNAIPCNRLSALLSVSMSLFVVVSRIG